MNYLAKNNCLVCGSSEISDTISITFKSEVYSVSLCEEHSNFSLKDIRGAIKGFFDELELIKERLDVLGYIIVKKGGEPGLSEQKKVQIDGQKTYTTTQTVLNSDSPLKPQDNMTKQKVKFKINKDVEIDGVADEVIVEDISEDGYTIIDPKIASQNVEKFHNRPTNSRDKGSYSSASECLACRGTGKRPDGSTCQKCGGGGSIIR